MKLKTIVGCVSAACGLVLGSSASAVVVGGIDFGPTGAVSHLETATLAETFVNAVGQQLEGYGLITSVNGAAGNAYCASGSCALYYHYYGYTVTAFSQAAVTFSGGTVDIFYSNTSAGNLLLQDSPTNIANISAMDEWVRLTGAVFADAFFNAIAPGILPGAPLSYTLNGFGSLTGGSLSVTGLGQLDSDTSGAFGDAAVAAYLDGNSESDGLGGFSDIVLTSSTNNSVLNPFDVANGFADSCKTAPVPGEWCFQGTLNIRGATSVVPEPGSLALVGLAFAALGASMRRKQVV